MKKVLKWLMGIVATLLVLVVLLIILLPLLFDPNEHKPEIQQLASDSLGREVLLNGPIEWSVFPWVAINLNDVTVANETGFQGDYLAQVNQVAVKVKLLPLLKKQIKVGEVVLKEPQINLQVAQSGTSNWQSILTYLEQDSSSSNEDVSSSDLEIRGISLTGGNLSFKDAGAGLQLGMENLTFSSQAIQSDRPTPMNLTAQVLMSEQGLKGQLNADWEAHNITDGDIKLLFKQLDFKGSVATTPFSAEAQSPVTLDLGKDSLVAEKMVVNYGVMNLTTDIKSTDVTANSSFVGQLQINAFAVDEMLALLDIPLNNQADNELSGNLQWSLSGDRLSLQGIQMSLDDSEVTGTIDMSQFSQLKGQFDLSVDQLNLDLYLPESEEVEASGASAVSDDVDFGQLQGRIKLNQLQAAGVQLSNIKLAIQTNGPNLTVEPLDAGFYQGLIHSELRLQPNNPTSKLSVSHKMQDFQAGSLLTDLMGTDYITGLGQLNANITIDQPFSERPLKSANGSLSYQLTDGDIVGIDVFQIMQQSLSLLNKTEAAAANAELKTAFGIMEIQANVLNGVLTTQKLRLTSPYFDLRGKVTIDLDQQTIDGTIKPMLTNIPEGVLDEKFSQLLNVRIPVSLAGSLLEPDVSVDVAQLILASQQSKIDEKKEELKEDLFDALLGNKDQDKDKDKQSTDSAEQQPEMTEKQKKKAEKDRRKKELLEGLFNNIREDDDKNKDDDTDGDNTLP